MPVLLRKGDQFAAVELFRDNLLVRIADEDGPAGSQGKKIGAGIRRFLGNNPALIVDGQAVDDDKTPAVMGVSGHKGFG